MNKVYVGLAILLIAVFVTSANGEVDNTERISNGFSYIVLEDGAVQITGYNPGISNVVIPSELDGRAVSSIGASAFAWTSIQSVEISEGITTIGNSAFAWCQNLSSISIPNSVTSIGDRAFYECRGIKDVIIPASVTSIGEEAFENCWQALFTVPYNSYAAYYCRNHDRINYICTDDLSDEPVNPEFGYSVLEDGTICITQCIADPESIAIPTEIDGRRVTCIGKDLFHGCRYLTSVTLPDGVISIGYRAFFNCQSLQDIHFPDSLQSIGDEAFFACEKLEAAIIPDGVSYIGSKAFAYCESMKVLSIPSKMSVLEDNVFEQCDSLTDVVIPEGITSINPEAFYKCDNLKTVSIPASVTQIYDSAFYYCPYVRIIVTANSYAEEYCIKNERIYTYIFDGNEEETEPEYTYYLGLSGAVQITSFRGKVQTLSIPDKIDGHDVRSIGYGAFYGRAHLTKVVIPSGVTSIEGRAFSACDNLTLIVIPGSVQEMYEDTFYYCPYIHVAVDPGTYAEGYCKQVGLRYIYISSIQDELEAINGSAKPDFEYVSAADGEIRITEYYGEEPELDIPSEVDGLKVTALDAGVFAEHDELLHVTIPNGVTNIGNMAFRNCSNLETVTIPKSVEKIGNETFSGCSGVTLIVAYGSYAEDYCIRHNFNYMYSDENMDTDEESIEAAYSYIEQEDGSIWITGYNRLAVDLIIPDEIGGKCVSGIGAEAFAERASLSSITIPKSVTHIDKKAFYSCKNLYEINGIEGLFSIGERAFYECCSLDGIELPEGIQTVGREAFSCSGISDIYMPHTIEDIGSGVFAWCKSLAFVEFADGIRTIPEDMFHGCNILDSVTIPGSVENIGEEAFYECSTLHSITFNAGLKHIGTRAFARCAAIKHIELPDGLETIDTQAFATCTELKRVVLPSSVSELGYAVFEDSGVKTIIADEMWRDYAEEYGIPFQVRDGSEMQYNINTASDMEDFLWKEENEGIVIIQYIGNESVVSVPDTIENKPVLIIGDSAFADISELQEVVLPDGLVRIGAYAFMNCPNLEKITIPASVQEFGKFAFNNDLNVVMVVNSGSYAEEYATSRYIMTSVK